VDANDSNDSTETSVHGLIDELRAGHISRRHFIEGLTALGISGAATALIVAHSSQHPTTPAAEKIHYQLHDQHITRQTSGNTNAMVGDYAEDAVVEDPLFNKPFIGKEAIATRYAAEVASVPDRSLTITNRTLKDNQLIVEWTASGTHVAPFLGIGGNGKGFSINGVTVVSRRDGKIIRESHFFNTQQLLRQIEG
jgi:steroid delta-isomerase-like uncharacterized protein